MKLGRLGKNQKGIVEHLFKYGLTSINWRCNATTTATARLHRRGLVKINRFGQLNLTNQYRKTLKLIDSQL